MENIGKINAWCLGQADRKVRVVVVCFFSLQLLKQGCVMKLLPSFHLGLGEFGTVNLSHNEMIIFNLVMCVGVS